MHVGRITVHPAGYGFVALDDGETTCSCRRSTAARRSTATASRSTPGPASRAPRVGSIEVLARGRARLTGILRRAGRVVYLEPDDPRIAADYGRVALDDAPHGRDGDAVRRRDHALSRRGLDGELAGARAQGARRSRRSAHRDREDPRVRRRSRSSSPTTRSRRPSATPQEVGAGGPRRPHRPARSRGSAPSIPRPRATSTTRSCIEDGPHGGPRVWVAVADVSHYVRWDDALDREAHDPRRVGVPARSRHPDAAARAVVRASARSIPDVDRWRWSCASTTTDDGELLDTRLRRGGDPLARRGSTTRASRRRSAATSAAAASSTGRGPTS